MNQNLNEIINSLPEPYCNKVITPYYVRSIFEKWNFSLHKAQAVDRRKFTVDNIIIYNLHINQIKLDQREKLIFVDESEKIDLNQFT